MTGSGFVLLSSGHLSTKFIISTYKQVLMISSFLFFCHKKAAEAPYKEEIQTPLVSRVFWLSFASDFYNLLLVRFNQAEIIILKHLIQEHNVAWLELEPSTLLS